MSSIKIKDLSEKTDDLNDEDLLIIEDKEDTKKITLLRLRSAFSMDSILSATKNMLLNKINTFTENHSSKYKELQQANTNLEVICHNLNNDHIHDAERIFELEDKLVKQTEFIESLQNDKDKLLETLSNLQQEKDVLSDTVSLLNTQISSNETSIIILKSQVKDLQIKSKELKQINQELQDSINILESQSNKQIEENLNNVNSKLTEFTDDIMAYIRYHHPDVDNIELN